MFPEIKDKWQEALMNCELEQGIGRMRSYEDEHDVLAVLCLIHAEETGGEWTKPEYGYGYMYLGSGVTLPTEVIRWSGLSPENMRFLSNLNDWGYTFEQIALILDTWNGNGRIADMIGD